MARNTLAAQLQRACRRLFSEQNRDPYSRTVGCLDRRFWAWKLVDFPEATFQRNAFALAEGARAAWMQGADGAALSTAAVNGLAFARRIQHADGSFDQAFPYERSFGATAFLLVSLRHAYELLQQSLDVEQQKAVEGVLHTAATFLCNRDEEHGHIANHLAAAALGLYEAGIAFHDERFTSRADALLDRIISCQSAEGWFMEYDGADPGYQTLCVHYLAQISRLRPEARLTAALQRSVEFLSWFVHPDGTFGGEYGSRRTSVFYPGGFCVLASENPLAAAIAARMIDAIERGHTTTLDDVDIANYAPVFESYVLALSNLQPQHDAAARLPYEQMFADADFPDAGLHVRHRPGYTAVVGASNGGVLRVYDRASGAVRWNDSGFVARVAGRWVSTQFTDRRRWSRATSDAIELEARFCVMTDAVPTPAKYLALRVLNLTLFRTAGLGNILKRWLVAVLITGKRGTGLLVRRTLRFTADGVLVTDTFKTDRKAVVDRLEFGATFRAIHMASAGYVQNVSGNLYSGQPRALDPAQMALLNAGGEVSLDTAV